MKSKFRPISWNMKYLHEKLLSFLNFIPHVSRQSKTCVYREKMSSDIENLLALNFDK